MTYLQWLQRYVELAIGDGTSTADTAAPGSPWLADTWRDRFAEMLKRRGPAAPATSARSRRSMTKRCWRIRSRRSPRCWAATRRRDHQAAPGRRAVLRQLCKTLGKPVNFVPVIDKDVRRWWRSDSLWQAHDARYTPIRCIIPGTQSVGGITRSTSRSANCWTASSRPRSTRCWRRTDSRSPWSPAVRRAPSPARWPVLDRPTCCGPAAPPSTRCTASAHRRAGDEWQATKTEAGHTPIHGCPAGAGGGDTVTLSVPLSGHLDQHPVHAAVLHGRRRHAGRHRRGRVDRDAFGAGHRRRRRRARRCPPVHDNTAEVTVGWDPEEVADHTGVTATFGAPLAPGLTLVPDALVGHCWPAVFAVIGSAVTDDGFPVVEGLLSLVHLDHAAHLLRRCPRCKPN